MHTSSSSSSTSSSSSSSSINGINVIKIVSVQFCKQVISKWFRPILKTRRGLNEFTNHYKTSASEILVIFPAQHSSSPTSSLTNCFLFAYKNTLDDVILCDYKCSRPRWSIFSCCGIDGDSVDSKMVYIM